MLPSIQFLSSSLFLPDLILNLLDMILPADIRSRHRSNGQGIGHFGKKVREGTKSLATSQDKVTGNQGSDKASDARR